MEYLFENKYVFTYSAHILFSPALPVSRSPAPRAPCCGVGDLHLTLLQVMGPEPTEPTGSIIPGPAGTPTPDPTAMSEVRHDGPRDEFTMKSGGVHIEKLDGHRNFSSWKFNMRMILILEGLWKCVLGEDTNPTRDQYALARICLGCTSTCQQYVQNSKTSKEAWESLCNVFEDSGLARKVHLLRQLHRIEYKNHNTMSEYIEHAMLLVNQLADINKKIADEEVAEILLSGLPQEYEYLVSNLETVCMTTTLSSEVVRSRLLQEETRKHNSENQNNIAYVSRNKNKPVRGCTFCHKTNHVRSRCFKLKKQKKEEMKSSGFLASAFLTTNNEWYLDSGCSQHYVQRQKLFS